MKNEEFKLLTKIKYTIEYCNEFIFSSFPKTDICLKIKFENALYNMIEECIRANVNKGNIRIKHIKEVLVNCYLCDYYIGMIRDKKIIKTNRYSCCVNALNEIVKMSNGWLNYEETK